MNRNILEFVTFVGVVLSAFCLFPVMAYPQRQFNFKEAGSGKPVQYANIYTGKNVYYSDSNGSVELPDSVSSFKVSHICYADTPGAGASNLKQFKWKNLPEGIYPFDK